MRKAFADALLRIGTENPRVVFLTADLGFQIFDDLRECFGPRYVNVGVAEAQTVCAAAGLALEGWRPVCYSIASFLMGRAFEQIRISVIYPRLPVVLVGAGGGYVYASSGPTHHAADDLALMSVLPGMTVVAPGDPNEVTQLLPQVFDLSGPAYFRIGRFGEATYHATAPAILGRARLLKEGERVAIVSTGDMASIVLRAAELLESERLFPFVYQMHTVKPLDTDSLEALAAKVETIIVVEEHLPLGGLSAAISLWWQSRQSGPRILRLGAPDAVVLGSPDREELRRSMHCDVDSIVSSCRAAWQRPASFRLA